jgi:Glycosyl transferase family 21
MSVAIGLLDPRSDLRSVANPDYGSRPDSRDCRHESVRKESPCCHRIVQGLRTISAKIGVSNPGSITQFFAEIEGLDAVNSWGRGEVCNSVQSEEPTRSNITDGLEQIALTTTWWSLLFFAASVFGSSCALGAAWAARWFVRQPASVPPARWPDVSILKPLYGAEAQLIGDYGDLFPSRLFGKAQLVFGAQHPNDNTIPVVESLIERYPELDLHFVVNPAAHGANRKISNLINMGQVSRHPLIVMADGDVAVGPNYLRTLAGALAQSGVGAVTCLYRGLPRAASGRDRFPWQCTIISCPARSWARARPGHALARPLLCRGTL